MTVIYTGRDETPQKARPALLPLLIALFIASYSILLMLVVEQGRTIEAQRVLLRDMLKDNSQLAELKGKLARDSEPQPPAKASANPSKDQSESAAVPAPGRPKAQGKTEIQPKLKAPHTMKEIPGKSAEDLEDVRRSTDVI